MPRPSATPAQPVVQFFTLAPPTIRAGDPVTLTWSATAEQVVIYRLDALGRLTMPVYEVPLSGTLVVTTSETLHNSVNFVLFAISPAGTAQAGAYATILCLDTWFFANPPASCPASPPHDTLMQAEHFERGLMLWTQWKSVIYVLYSDGLLTPGWQAKSNAWFSGMPLSDPSLIPPAGRYQPVRGFGLTWRDEQATPGYRVRDRLGWATDEEFSVSGAMFQCDSAPKYNTCYLTGPDNKVYELKPEGSSWSVWTGPTPTPG